MTTADVVLPPEVFECNSVAEHVSPGNSVIVKENTVSNLPQSPCSSKCIGNEPISKGCSDLSVQSCSSESTVKNKSRSCASKRKPNKRKKRKWRPYYKLSWTERQEVAKRDTKRAFKIREEMSASGITLAPYNTTQFLMEDHNLQEPDYSSISLGHRHRENSVGGENSGDEVYYSSPEDEGEFLQRQFVETYDDMHAERLSTMTSTELVEEYISMEDQVEELEKSLSDARHLDDSERTPVRPVGFNIEAELEKIRVFREEIEKLTLENDILERQNEILRLRLVKA